MGLLVTLRRNSTDNLQRQLNSWLSSTTRFNQNIQLIVTYGDKGGTTMLGPFCLVLSDMQYYFISFGACINPILLALAAPGFWCKWSRSSEKPVENEQDTIIHSLLGSEEKI